MYNLTGSGDLTTVRAVCYVNLVDLFVLPQLVRSSRVSAFRLMHMLHRVLVSGNLLQFCLNWSVSHSSIRSSLCCNLKCTTSIAAHLTPHRIHTSRGDSLPQSHPDDMMSLTCPISSSQNLEPSSSPKQSGRAKYVSIEVLLTSQSGLVPTN